jgi:oxepin-CoA hydrolase/3-oxo-5,6-dehydrosuberyl-CoA semialdehyde dehydrogenase
MMTLTLHSYARDRWAAPAGRLIDIPSAIDGRLIAQCSTDGLDFAAMVRHARTVGNPALRALTFHQRADLLRALAGYLNERRAPLYALSADTGATQRDNLIASIS